MFRLGRVHGNLDDKSSLRPRLLSAALVLGGLAVGAIVWQWDSVLARHLPNQSTLVSYLRADGVVGPLSCVLAQFLQVVIFIIPGEVTQLASGYVFGAGWGFLYAAIGILLGSAFNFYFGRVAGRSILRHFLSAVTLDKVARVLNSNKGKVALFVLFLLPGTPKDAMCYALGLSTMSVTEFVIITGLARTPALLASILIGAYASSRDYTSMLLVGVAVVLAVGGCYLYERNRNRALRERGSPAAD